MLGRGKNQVREEAGKSYFTYQPGTASWRKKAFPMMALGAFSSQAGVPSSGTAWQC